ncbi:MAG: ATP-binding protein [Candidatus Woesearchaeota archaeon]
MECENCNNSPVLTDPRLCSDHYIEWFERTIEDTIKEYGLIDYSHKIVVAASGGKDSTTVLYILRKLGYNVTALAIDEGIPGYRDKTLEDLKSFCNANGIGLKVVSFKEQLGSTLTDNIKKIDGSPCRACGIMRRYLLNKHSKDYDIVATGHNLDDEYQSIMMSLYKGNLHLALRLGPKSGKRNNDEFTQRVKPLYFLSEKQVFVYGKIRGFNLGYNECPYARLGYRNRIRETILEVGSGISQKRINTVKNILLLKKATSMTNIFINNKCQKCNGISNTALCVACRIKEAVFQ